VLEELLSRQHGILTRSQALASGLSDEAIGARLRSGRWQRAGWGVYATFTGPLPRLALLWAAQLAVGRSAVLSHESAGELIGLVDEAPSAVHVTVPLDSHLPRRPGIVLHRSARWEAARHPSRLPAQTRVEETVLDLVESSDSLEQAAAWLTRACGRRLTTAGRLLSAMADRKRMRWRRELRAILGDVGAGAHSPLELRYLRSVERAHGLPRGDQQADRARPGGRYYDDVRYAAFAVLVELDGRLGHPDDMRFRDLRRDNAAAESGTAVLRYGWADVTQRPCAVARKVAKVLQGRGWRGQPRPCPRCSS
jgi:Transcriptional regulator, AbiEi antitoxin